MHITKMGQNGKNKGSCHLIKVFEFLCLLEKGAEYWRTYVLSAIELQETTLKMHMS